MSLFDVCYKTGRSKTVVQPTKPTLQYVPPKDAYFVPAKDKVIAIDKSKDCNVERSRVIDSGFGLQITVDLLFRRLLNVRPELEFVCKHTANVFQKKTCYIFYDTKRKVKVAYTRKEAKEELSKR